MHRGTWSTTGIEPRTFLLWGKKSATYLTLWHRFPKAEDKFCCTGIMIIKPVLLLVYKYTRYRRSTRPVSSAPAPAAQSTSDRVWFVIDTLMCSTLLYLQPIQRQRMMLLSALRAECAFLSLKIWSVFSSADTRRKERAMAAARWEAPLSDTPYRWASLAQSPTHNCCGGARCRVSPAPRRRRVDPCCLVNAWPHVR